MNDDVRQYDYRLPAELIAQHPLAQRSDARLMVVDRRRGEIRHAHVRDLPEFLQPADAMVVNDSRVVPARLVGRRDLTGGRWQGLFMNVDDHGNWRVLCKTRGRLKPGEEITLIDREANPTVKLAMLTRLDQGAWLVRVASPGEDTWALLDRIGRVPLPPYIRRGEMVDEDRQRYQTVYADQPGSVAAPTAGLHLTKPLMEKITQRGVTIQRLTLHVGLGTFRPMNADRLQDHVMHSEIGRLDAATAQALNDCRRRGGRVVAVGTTSVRVLESAAAAGTLQPWSGRTDLFIRPPYQFKAVDALLTNFHLPRSTLLVLIRTFGGDALMRRAYDEAIAEEYRFFSYGDAMLIH